MQFIRAVASQLRLNYIVDPAVKGVVNITTLGNLRTEDLMPVLEDVLQINGATAVQVGNFYRIVPLSQAAKTPLSVFTDATGKTLPQDDRVVMEIIPLRFVSAADMAKMLTSFLSPAGSVAVHEAGNTLILVDSSLNVKRLTDILEQFDSATFAQQRVRLFPINNNVASGLVPELESIFSAYALSEKNTPLHFVPLDRINAILVAAADPSAFEEVEKWVTKLDLPAAPSGIQTFVYKVQNSEAGYLATLLGRIRGVKVATGAAPGSSGGGATPTGTAGGELSPPRSVTPMTSRGGGTSLSSGLGSGLGSSTQGLGTEGEGGEAEASSDGARIIADPVNNSIIIESTAQEYADIVKTLKELDVIPRQVLIEARVYEVDLNGDLEFGLQYFLQERSNAEKRGLASLAASGALQASAGTLIGQSREFLAFLNASQNRSRVRVLSAPSVLATDNTEARIQVGSEVPTLTSQAVVGGVAVGSTNVFSNTVSNRDTGVILSVVPRITSTGLVSLKISQEISSQQPPPAGAIQSPSFLKRSVITHALVQDGETITLGGLIQQTITTTHNRIPLLGDIPVLGALFGSTSYVNQKTELIVLLRPRIVKNPEEARDATGELLDKLRDVRRGFKTDVAVNPPAAPKGGSSPHPEQP